MSRRESGEDKSIIRDTIAIVFATSQSRRLDPGVKEQLLVVSRRRGRRPCRSLPFAISSGAVCLVWSTRNSLCPRPPHLDTWIIVHRVSMTNRTLFWSSSKWGRLFEQMWRLSEWEIITVEQSRWIISTRVIRNVLLGILSFNIWTYRGALFTV